MHPKNWVQKVICFLRKDDGPTAVEYAVMLALIIVLSLSTITALGGNANSTFGSVFGSSSESQSQSSVVPVGGTSPGYTSVPTGETWGLSLAGGTTVSYNSTTGVETIHWGSGGTQTSAGTPGKLGSDRGQLWNRNQ